MGGQYFLFLNQMKSICVEKQFCAMYCVFNKLRPIYGLGCEYMHN